VICDEEVCARAGWTVASYAGACIDGGARLLQLRLKNASGQRFLETAMAVLERASAAGTQVVVNDRADIARLSGAAGVHVGQDDLSPSDVRRVVGHDALVGVSTHTPDQVRNALGQPLSYLATGPVFATATKDTGYHAVGLAAVRDASRLAHQAGLELVAIGGITLERAASVVEAGADAVAVIGDLLATGDPAARVRQFLVALSHSPSILPSARRDSHQEPQ
jgi:thiamine-phosphate pyrophosphorylase